MGPQTGSALSPDRTHTTASLWMLRIPPCSLGWNCLWWEPQLEVGGGEARAAPGAVLQYKY